MATVTVYTADRMKNIEDSSVVSGQVVGDNLILTKKSGATMNAGNVRGPRGSNGAPGYTSIVVCSSTSRPTGAALFNGLAIFETDTNKFLIWNGIRWDPPWNTAWGQIGYIERTTDAGPVTGAEVSIGGMSINVPVVANRRVKASISCTTYGATGSGPDNISFVRLVEDSIGISSASNWNHVSNYGASVMCSVIRTPSAGVHNYYMRAGSIGNGGIWVMGRPDCPMCLMIEDVGPAGPPA